MSEITMISSKIKKPFYYYIFVVAVSLAIVACAVLTILSFIEIKLPRSPEEIRLERGYSEAVKCVKQLKDPDEEMTLYSIEKTMTSGGNYYKVIYSKNNSTQKSACFKYYKSQLHQITEDIYNHYIANYIAISVSNDDYFGKQPSSPQTRIQFSADALALIAEDTGVLYHGA